VVLVIEPLVDCLGLLQPSAGISEEFVALNHAFGHRSHPRLAWFIRANGGGLAAVDNLEWCCLQHRLESSIVDEFRPWQLAQPFVEDGLQ
jgi:hypothetical protein